MYELAEPVTRWLAEQRPVLVARAVQTEGISSREHAAAVAHSPGQPLAGQLFSGVADAELVELFEGFGDTAGTAWLRITEDAARSGGLSCGGRVQLLVQPATDLAAAWPALLAHQPVCVVTDLPAAGPSRVYHAGELTGHADGRLGEIGRLARRGFSQTVLLAEPDQVLTALWPAIRVLIVGDGQIADALSANAELLGWAVQVADELGELTAADNVIVLSHDLDLSGRALQAALAGDAGYLGALGSRHTQAARAAWLAEHGTAPAALEKIHGPAGLDIGSRTPAEIALSILAEMVLVRRG